MNNKIFIFFWLVILPILLIGCSKNVKTINEEFNANINTDIIIVDKINITEYFYNEILKGNKDMSFSRGINGVKDFFGEPLEEIIIPTSFYFGGGTIIEMHEYVYNDFVHYYYVSENGSRLYKGFSIKKPLERLKTVNIGDFSIKLLSQFDDTYFTWGEHEQLNENISYYTNPVVCEIQFIINDTIIEMIFCNFLLI